MNNIYFKVKKIEKESYSTFDKSKMFGSPVFPRKFFKKHRLDNYFFLMQVNLKDLEGKQEYLPSIGYLYFFLDISSYPYYPKVIYSNEEVIEVYDDINEIFSEYGDYHGYELVFDFEGDSGNYLLGNIDEDLDLDSELDTTGYISLLQLDSLSLPEGMCQLSQPDGWYIFLIKKEDLENLNFRKVKFIDFGS